MTVTADATEVPAPPAGSRKQALTRALPEMNISVISSFHLTVDGILIVSAVIPVPKAHRP